MLVTLLGMVTLVRQCSMECDSPDAGDAVADGDARQASAVIECVNPDAGDAVGNGDARQASAATNALSPMLVTLLGMCEITARQACVPANLHSAFMLPMLVTLLGMVTLVRQLQLVNAYSRCW